MAKTDDPDPRGLATPPDPPVSERAPGPSTGRGPNPSDEEDATLPFDAAKIAAWPPTVGGPHVIEPTFSSGSVLADRFRIVRFLAQGGMGEVYEADDPELRERVALKTIQSRIANDAHVMDRFRREVQLSRKVTSPHVCRIFDVFRHRIPSAPVPGGRDREIAFLTMELLPGETLAERLDGCGRLDVPEAFLIARQMVAGLAAAHRAGVVHRDFKSGNVMLVPSADEPEGLRVVVTDFGLAQATATGESPIASLTASGFVAGTPAYMAPEQIEGGEIHATADIYALGIVLYEMVTGTRPFSGDTPLSVAVKRLKEAPVSPLVHVPDLDPKWEKTIMRCLERDPADRFGSVEEVVQALAGEAVAPPRRLVAEERARAEAARRRRHRVALAAVGSLLLAAAAWIGMKRLRPAGGAPPVSPTGAASSATLPARRSVAVLGFKNLAARPDTAWMSIAFAEMLTTELTAGEKLRTVSGENVARAKLELSLSDAESLAPDTLARVRKNLGTDIVVLGSYLALGDKSGGQLRLDLRVQDAVSGETLASIAETGTESTLFDVVSRAGASLRDKLGAGTLTASEAVSVRASQPASPDAARLYAEGLARLRVFDALAARDLLERAVVADPKLAPAHSALSAAWRSLGYDAKADAEAKRALDLSGALSREERLSIEARYREATKEWDKAIDIYRTLFGFFPDNLDYGLRLAGVQRTAGRSKDSLATIATLRALPAPSSEDPRIDLAEALARTALSDFQTARDRAARAAREAGARGARLLVARARNEEGWALWNLGESDAAIAACKTAQRLFDEAGDRAGAASALTNLAVIAMRKGNLVESRRLTEEALSIQREIGNQRGVAFAANNLGSVLSNQGDNVGARRAYEIALQVNRETANKRAEAGVLGNLANIDQYEGNLASALRLHETSLALYREVGDKRSIAIELNNTGTVLVDQGKLSDAKRMFEEALALKREIGSKTSIAFSLCDLGEVLQLQGDLDGAKRLLDEALRLRTETNEKGRTAETQLLLADLAIDRGQFAEARSLVAPTIEAFRGEKDLESEARAHAITARALLAEGKPREARESIARALALDKQIETRRVRLGVRIVAARIDGAEGRSAAALEAVEAVLVEARKLGLYGVELEARLAAGEIAVAAGQADAGRARLAALERDARARGFGLIATQAARARTSHRPPA